MADVTLRFNEPSQDGLAALRVYEGSAKTGPFTQIDRTTAIGSYPSYITSYMTTLATSADDWFTIAWEDSNGAVGDMSVAVQGGTETIVGKVVQRVLQRDGALDLLVVQQEAEVAIQQALGETQDPYATDVDLTYKVLNGMVYLTMARCYIFESAEANEQVQLGMVRFSESSSGAKNIDKLIALASSELNIGQSRVLQMARHHHRYRIPVEVYEV